MNLSTFDDFIPEADLRRAKQNVANTLGVEPEELRSDMNAPLLVQLAQEGDADAQFVLYSESILPIARAFFRNFLGPNKKVHRARIEQGDDRLWASVAWEEMLKALKSFDVSKYAYGATKNFIGKWHWWYYNGYLRNEAIRLNKERSAEGFTGDRAYDQVQTQQMPTTDRGEDRSTISLSDPDSHTASTDLETVFQSYMSRLALRAEESTEAQRFLEILTMRLQGSNPQEIADRIGLSIHMVRRYLRAAKDDMINFGVFESAQKITSRIREARKDIKRGVALSENLNIPDWQPFTDLKINQAMKFRARKVNDHITHHVSPCYVIVETMLPNRKATYTMYLRLPAGSRTNTTQAKREYLNNADLLVTNHRSPRVMSMSQAKNLLRQHFNSGGALSGGIDPSSPQHWINSLSGR